MMLGKKPELWRTTCQTHMLLYRFNSMNAWKSVIMLNIMHYGTHIVIETA